MRSDRYRTGRRDTREVERARIDGTGRSGVSREERASLASSDRRFEARDLESRG